MSALQQHDEGLKGYQCPASLDVESLTSTIRVLTEKIDTLIQLNRDIIKWLLVVVCIIALGRSAFDVGKDIFAHTMSRAVAESTK